MNKWSPGRDLGLRAHSLMSVALNFLKYTHRRGPIFLSFPGIILIICPTQPLLAWGRMMTFFFLVLGMSLSQA